jgi:hypothetical protein
MKKNQCPPAANHCGGGKLHIDIGVPGYDNERWSISNICGKPGTLFPNRKDSFVCGEWYKKYQDTRGCIKDCSVLPGPLRSGCQLFSSWGWKSNFSFLFNFS